MSKAGSWKAGVPPIYTPTPCRGGMFHNFIEKSRTASGVDEARGRIKHPEEVGAQPAEVELPQSSHSPEERPTSSRRTQRKSPGEKVGKRKEPAVPKTATAALQEVDRKRRRKTPPPTDPAPSLATVVAVDEFVSKGSGNGRPQRARCPVLDTWRGEKVMYSREPGSATPHVTGFHIIPEESLKGGKASRKETLPMQGRSKRVRPKAAKRTCSEEPVPLDELTEKCSSPEPLDVVPDTSEVDEPMSLLPHHTKTPTKSLLRSKDSARKTGKVSWSVEQREFVIEKVAFTPELWEPVEPQTQCNHCQRMFLWGSEIDYGNFAAAREHNFEEVFCKGCRATDLFARIGGWFLVSCACREAGFSADPSEAMMLVQQLIRLGPMGRDPDEVWRILRLEEATAWYEIMQKALLRIEEAFTITEDLQGGLDTCDTEIQEDDEHEHEEPEEPEEQVPEENEAPDEREDADSGSELNAVNEAAKALDG